MKMRIHILVTGMALIGTGLFLLWPSSKKAEGSQTSAVSVSETVDERPPMKTETIEILPKATFGVLMEESGVSADHIAEMLEVSASVFDLTTIRAGKKIDLTRDQATNDLKGLVYAPNTEEELHLDLGAAGWKAELKPIDYEIVLKTSEGTIESSLYESAIAQGIIDERAIIALADVFQWTIDFAQDVRTGDTYKFVYEERYRNGTYVMPGRVLAAKYINAGTERYAYLFTNASEEDGYYDESGASLRKMFLKAPVAFKYITSNFTTGLRYVSAFNVSTGHRAIDYAASAGTPIRATADGTVVRAGWNGSYGNFTSIRHNETYTTNYAHQSKIAVRVGQKVSQSQVIGYVGSTGFSTGPHLHYEMVKRGTKINPLREEFPGTDPVKPEERADFDQVVSKWREAL